MEGIGITLDLKGEPMFVTDLGGSIYLAKLDEHGCQYLLMLQCISIPFGTCRCSFISYLQECQ